MKKLLLGLLCAAGCLTVGKAEQIPQSAKEDVRVKHVAFEENNVVNFSARTFITTQIVFSPKESVLTVEGGDTAGWMVTYHDNLPNMVFVKPTLLASKTNMTIVTTKHNYYFAISSNASVQADTPAIYAIKFRYPEEEQAKVEAQRKAAIARNQLLKAKHPEPKQLNWNYRFSGNGQIKPIHVYDDGHFTYFELEANQPVPAIFAVDDKQGKEAIVNTRRQGNILVVQRLAPQFTLRHGGMVASIFNSNEIARLNPSRRMS